MKTHRKIFLMLLLISCMIFTTMPATAFSVSEAGTGEHMEGSAAEEEETSGEDAEKHDEAGAGKESESAASGEPDKASDTIPENREYSEEELEDFSMILELIEFEGDESDSWDAGEDEGEEWPDEDDAAAVADEGDGDGDGETLTLMAANGTKAKFTSGKWKPFNAKRYVRRFKSSFTSSITGKKEDFIGTCSFAGIPALTSGKAKLTRVKNTSAVAKMVWYYGYELGWWNTKKGNASAKNELGLKSCATTKRELVTAICQVSNQGRSSYISYCQSGCGMTKSFATRMANFVKSAKTKTANVKVPATFEIYKGVPLKSNGKTDSSHQTMYLWYIKPDTGAYLSLTKVSASGKDFTGALGDPESDGEGEGSEAASEDGEESEGDDEEAPGEGDWGDDLDDEIFGEDTAGDDPANEASDENLFYSLEGAEYQVYTTAGKAVSGAVLVTDENGLAGPIKIDAGTYKVKETKASKGFALDPTEYTVTVKAANTKDNPAEAGIKISGDTVTPELPIGALPDLTVYKIPDPEPDYANLKNDPAPLTGAEFIVRYYRVKDKADIENAKCEAAWKYVAVEHDYYIRNADGIYPKVAGFSLKTDRPAATSRGTLDDPFYHAKADGSDKGVIPLGWLTITESKAPDGYLKSSKISYVNIADAGGKASVICIDEDGNKVTASGGGYKMKVKNMPVTVATTAVSAATNMHIGVRSSSEKITDKVHMTGLEKGRNYRISAQLMNKRTEQAVDGAAAVSKDFTAEASVMDVTMDISFDSTKLGEGDSVVVYETLYSISTVNGDSVSAELAKHQDINDEGQTVIYPSIYTSASLQNDSSEIKDIITYKGLLPDMKYVFKGWLVDTASGTKVPDSDGRIELNTGSNTSGEAGMILRTGSYDDMSGHSMTAFEELYVVEKDADGSEKETLIAEHKDKNDKNQTVEIYHDLKVKKNVTGNLGDLTKVFEYTLEFTGLVPGCAYQTEGDDEKTFMADNSGAARIPVKLKDGQEAVVRDLPKGASYVVTEAASDHVAEYRMYSEDMEDKGARITVREANNGNEAAKILSTARETVDLFDGTIVVLWENNRDLATLTGVRTYTGIWAVASAFVLAGIAALIISRRKLQLSERNLYQKSNYW